MDVRRYLPNGERDLKPYPYIYINSPELSDTLTLHAKHTLYIKLVNISDSLISAGNLILTNTLIQGESGHITVTDTIAIIHPDHESLYKFDFVPTREGEDRFLGFVYCKRVEGKFMDVITLGFTYPFSAVKGKGRTMVHQTKFFNNYEQLETGQYCSMGKYLASSGCWCRISQFKNRWKRFRSNQQLSENVFCGRTLHCTLTGEPGNR